MRGEHVAHGLPPDVVEDECLYPGADLPDLRPRLPPLPRGPRQVQLHHRRDPRDVPRDLLPRRDLLLYGPAAVPDRRLLIGFVVHLHLAELVVEIVAEAWRGRAQERLRRR